MSIYMGNLISEISLNIYNVYIVLCCTRANGVSLSFSYTLPYILYLYISYL